MIKFLVVVLMLVFSFKPILANGARSRIISSNNVYSSDTQTQVTNLKIGVKPDTSIPNGKFQILLFATDNTNQASDGLPDFNAFDLLGATATCPTSIPGVFEFGLPQLQTATNANYKFVDGYYHVLTCPYVGSGDLKAVDNLGYTNANYFEIENLINPKFDSNLSNAQLVYAPIWISQMSNGDAIIYNDLQTVTSSRQVEMLATISPQITFKLEGVPTGLVACGTNNQQTTSATLANFGVVNNTDFTNIVQELYVSTNSRQGYVVTAIASDQMGLENSFGAPATCLGNANTSDNCLPFAQVGGMSASQTALWTSPNQGKGLAFSMQNITGNNNVFNYNQGYRQFADEEVGENPVLIVNESGPNQVSDNYLCYRAVAKNSNLNGFYSNSLTYTLTAKF